MSVIGLSKIEIVCEIEKPLSFVLFLACLYIDVFQFNELVPRTSQNWSGIRGGWTQETLTNSLNLERPQSRFFDFSVGFKTLKRILFFYITA